MSVVVIEVMILIMKFVENLFIDELELIMERFKNFDVWVIVIGMVL